MDSAGGVVKVCFEGVVLAGGRSSRMGRSKALLRVDGVPLWKRQAAALRAAGARRVWVSLRRGQRTLGSRRTILRDPVRDCGPLSGIAAALASCKEPFIMVLAVDLPAMTGAWIRRLARESRGSTGVVVRTSRGYEPLAALYPASAGTVALRRLGRRQLALQAFVAELERKGLVRAVRRPVEDPALCNANRPGDVNASKAP